MVMQGFFTDNRHPMHRLEIYILVYGAILLCLAFLSPIAFAVVLASFAIIVVLEPFVSWLQTSRKIGHTTAHIIALLVFFAAILLLFLFLLPNTIREANGFFRFLNDFFTQKQWQPFFKKHPELMETLSPTIEKIYPKLMVNFDRFMLDIQRSSMTILSFIFYTLLVTVYWSFFFKSFKAVSLSLFPVSIRDEAAMFLKELYYQLKRYLFALVVVATIVGIIFGVFLTIIGSRYSVILGFWAFFTNFIPIVGVIFEIIPLFILCFSLGIGKSIALLLAVGIIHPFAFILFLNLMKGAIQINPVVIILLILVFSQLFGIVGSIIAVPAGIVIRVYWRSFIAPRLAAG
jgi:predicted PurR-regulated permease PerM